MKLAANLLFALLAITPSCVAQDGAKTPPKEPFVIEAGEVQLTALIDRCAAYLDCNILTTPQEMAQASGAVTAKLQKAVRTDRDGCEEFLANMLYRSGFALTYMDGKGETMEVISMAGPRAREIASRALPTTAEAVMARPSLKLWVITTLPLKHTNATIATNALRPFFASTGNGPGSMTLGNVGNNTSLLLCGPQDQVAGAIRLIQKCDVPNNETFDPNTGMPVPTDRIQALERRVKTLEERLAPTDGKKNETK
jgi:hypothetical protein